MYEHRNQPPLTRGAFLLRLALHSAVAFGVLALCLAVGMAGYRWFESCRVDTQSLPCIKTWRDAFLNASMLLGGMGPVHTPQTDGGKVFAGLYALFAGIIFVAAAGIVIAPVLHRLLHLFHRGGGDADRHQ